MANKEPPIKATGMAFSAAAIFYITFIYIGIKLGLLILLIPLSHFFPIFKEYDWIRFIPEILTLGILISHPFCSFYSVLLYKDSVILKKFGIKIKEIPVSEFKSFCLVGNDREDMLCLSRYSFEEMSRMQEARLARGVFSKHELPFMKRKANWQDDFTKGYLFHLRKSPFNAFKKRNVIMLDMHPALQYSIQKMYPQLPYKNLTAITSPYLSRFSEIPANQVFCFQMQTSEYTFRMENDGIHIETKKKKFSPFLQTKSKPQCESIFSHHTINSLLPTYPCSSSQPCQKMSWQNTKQQKHFSLSIVAKRITRNF